MIAAKNIINQLKISQFTVRTRIIHGAGSTRLIGSEATGLGITRAIVVTDQGVRNAGLLEPVIKSLTKNKITHEIFDKVPEDADVTVIHRITVGIKKAGCNGIIVVGGGSPICAAKGAALEVTNKVKTVRELEGRNVAKVMPLPVVCLPTTAGSGSDVSAGFPILDHAAKRHFGISGDMVAPRVSILDPEVLKTCPHSPMIYAGIDALCHPLETLWSKMSTPFAEALAFEAINLIMNNLKDAVLTDNREAKLNQQIGCSLGMIAGDIGNMGLVHGLAGVVFSLKGPHGYKCGVLLPHAMEFNLPYCEEKFARAAIMIGESSEVPNKKLARLFINRVKELLVAIDFPKRFAKSDLKRADIPEVIQEARRTSPSFLDFNIRTVTDENAASIIEAAMKDWQL
jgi:alcohol dehydrogenase class IV